LAIAVGVNVTLGTTLFGVVAAADGVGGVVSPTVVEVIISTWPELVVVNVSTRV
jgi:hypothetical protein